MIYSLRVLMFLALMIPSAVIGQGIVRGIVSDSTEDAPLIGANIHVKGTALGGISDLDGRFRIAGIPEGLHVLRFSYVGYVTREIQLAIDVQGEVFLNISLLPDVIESWIAYG